MNKNVVYSDDTPAKAGRDYVSGVFYGWFGDDVKADMDVCFPDSQELTDEISVMFRAYEAEEWCEYQNSLMRQKDLLWNLFNDNCSDNEKVMDAVQDASDVITSFESNSDWWELMSANYNEHKHEI